MKILKISLVLAAVLLFVFACSETAKNNSNSVSNAVVAVNTNVASTSNSAKDLPADSDELASARKIYSEQCINCHKEGGIGGTSNIDGKQIKAPNFTSERMKKDNDKDWIETIHDGAVEDGMPAFKNRLTDEQIKSLVKLIRKDFQGM